MYERLYMKEKLLPFFMSVFFITCIYITQLIPPFQSPDEFDHLERGYLLSKGVIFMPLNNEPALGIKSVVNWQDKQNYRGETGGSINAGLYRYMQAFEGLVNHPTIKLSKTQIENAKRIYWSKESVYRTAPSVSVYFPAIYLPHAVGFWLGEHLGLSLDNTYYLIRYLLITGITLILFYALRLSPVSPLVVYLLLLPMSLYQFSSATLDGIATALCVLIIAMFLTIVNFPKVITGRFFYGLMTLILIISTARLQALPFLFLLFYAAHVLKKKSLLISSYLASVLIGLWIIYASTSGTWFSKTGSSSHATVSFYFNNLGTLYDLFYKTLTHSKMLNYYFTSFLGVIGWGDGHLHQAFYQLSILFSILMTLMCASVQGLKYNWRSRMLLCLTSLSSLFIIFFSLLLAWSPIGSEVILGVQGRYFLIPALCLAYALGGETEFGGGIKRKFAIILLFIFYVYSLSELITALLQRFYG